MKMFVNCSCGERHYSGEIEALDIEEDFMGRDVITYICPTTNEEKKAYAMVDQDR